MYKINTNPILSILNQLIYINILWSMDVIEIYIICNIDLHSKCPILYLYNTYVHCTPCFHIN